MGKEIERKFLVNGNSYRDMACHSQHIRQGYLNTNPDSTVRIRIKDSHGYITVKGRTTGITRNEWEYEIPLADAEEMLERLCGAQVIDKVRYVVNHGNLQWEIDEFHGSLEGLVLAEVELPDETYAIDKFPDFIGREVSDDPRYFNSALIMGDIS